LIKRLKSNLKKKDYSINFNKIEETYLFFWSLTRVSSCSNNLRRFSSASINSSYRKKEKSKTNNISVKPVVEAMILLHVDVVVVHDTFPH
jgi:hypothetical protein